MKVLQKGIKYLLGSIDGTNDQELVFMSKQSNREFHEEKAGESLPDYFFEALDIDPDEVNLVQDGTSNEEVLKVLIDRTETLNEKVHSDENEEALDHLRAALEAFRRRTAARRSRGVQGTTVA